MSTVADFTLEPDEFPLGDVFARHADATVEFERAVPAARTDAAHFWVRGVGADAEPGWFDDHPGVRDVRVVASAGGDHLLRCRWADDHDCVFDALDDPTVVLRSAVGTAEGWTFEVRAGSQSAIARFREYCHDHDVPVALRGLYGLDPPDGSHDLTDKQRETLLLAHERGYFDTPREAALGDLAADLDITQQAVASRLRRGTRRLVEAALVESDP